MAFRKILQYPDSQLRKVSTDIDFSADGLEEIVQDLVDTLDVTTGAGLAAPQIGYEKNVLVLHPRSFGVENPDPFPQREQFMVMVNPKLKLSEKETRWTEACLSVPLGKGVVTRSETCEVEYWTPDGEEKHILLEWPLSGAMQHEYDHLEGKLYIDRVSRFTRESINKKIVKFNKEKARETERKKQEEILDLHGPAALKEYKKRNSKGSTKKKFSRKKRKPKVFGRKKKKK